MWCLRFIWWWLRRIGSPLINKNLTNPENPGFVILITPSRSYRTYKYIQAAEQLNLRLIIVSDSPHSLVSSIANGININFDEQTKALETIINSIDSVEIKAVISTDDICAPLASMLATKLNLPHNELNSAILTYRKDLARQALQKSNCNYPDFKVITELQINSTAENINYPAIIKPVSLSGSRGVIRANNKDEFKVACKRAFSIIKNSDFGKFEKNHLLIEEYLDGIEFALDAFLINGKIKLLALFDKPNPLEGPFFEESIYITPSKYPKVIQHSILKEVQRCAHAFGLKFGPIHAEVRVCNDKVYLIEMASRSIGGQCAQMLEYSLGAKLEEIILSYACSSALPLNKQNTFPGVLMIPIEKSGLLKRVEGLLAANNIDGIQDIEIHIQPGYELTPLPEGNSYLGFIFALTDRYETTIDALNKAHAELKFITQTNWSLEQV